MTRKTPFKILILSALLAGLLPLLFACNKSEENPCHPPIYDMHILYDESAQKLSVTQEILYTAKGNLSEIVLHIFANAFIGNNDAIDILNAQINRKTVDCVIFGEDKTLLSLPCNLKKGETTSILLKYNLTVPKGDLRFGMTSKNTLNLTCFYPIVAAYENGFRKDLYCQIGDPFFSDASTYFVTVTLPSHLDVASSGKRQSRPLAGGKKEVSIEAENVRDFGMAIGEFEKAERKINLEKRTVSFSYFHQCDPNAEETADRAADAILKFSKAFGEFPHDDFTLVESPLNAGGMEYGGFAIVAPCQNRESYLDAVTHEIAHSWWFDGVGNDQINKAWLDEGLAEFCTHYYHLLSGDKKTYALRMQSISKNYSSFCNLKGAGFSGQMNRPLSSFLSEGEYVAVAYFKGALLFDELLSLMGETKLNQALFSYYEKNLHLIADENSLKMAFQSVGYDISGILTAWICDLVIN